MVGLLTRGVIGLYFSLFVLAACDNAAPTLRPVRTVSAPTLAPSPTVNLLSSDQLYGDTAPSSVGVNNLTAAAIPNDGGMPPISSGVDAETGIETVTIITDDGASLVGDLYQRGDARRAGVLMIGAPRSAWGLLPLTLQNAGYTVLVVELRPQSMMADIHVLLLAMDELGSVNSSRIAVIGAAEGADLALMGCATDVIPDNCDALILISPLSRDTLLNMLAIYGSRPLMVAAATTDSESFPTALALAQASRGAEFVQYEQGRGTALLQLNDDFESQIVSWLTQNLTP